VATVGGVVGVLAVIVVVSNPNGRSRSWARTAVARPPTVARYRATTTTNPDRGFPTLLPTAAVPLRVLEIGDSLGIDLGDQLRSFLGTTGRAEVTVASVGDSGLSNVSFYDWPLHLALLLTTDRPQVVVVFLGTNDDQGLDVDGAAAEPGTPAWAAGYTQRVDDVLEEATRAGVRVVWVGVPPMENFDLNEAMERENAIFQGQTESFPGTLYVPSAAVLGNASGSYEPSGVDGSGGEVALRTPDGVHLTPDGAGVLAQAVIDAVDRRWHLGLTVPAP
jgi:hypothetical protein